MSDGSSLCLSCGLCCDGTVFRHVDLQPDDVEHAQRLLPVVREPRPRFHQPCPGWSATRGCGHYDERPGPCARYRCRTLAAFEEGRLTWEDAQARIERARTLAARAWSALPQERGAKPLMVASAQHLRTPAGRSQQEALMATLLELAEVLMVDFDVAASIPGRAGSR